METFKSPSSEKLANTNVESDPTGRFDRSTETLGRGAYKTVYRAFDNDLGIEVAWNAIGIDSLDTATTQRFLSEIDLLSRLKHPNIIQLLHAWTRKEDGKFCFITELMTSGTLSSYLRKIQGPIKKRVLVNWCKQILTGLEYLHNQSPPVIHRDLKAENILVNGNTVPQATLKISDLGLATVKSANVVSSVLGTPGWMAPELFEEGGFDERVDIFAFGMCVLEMITKEYPYSELQTQVQVLRKITNGIRPAAMDKVEDREVREFIELCIQKDPSLRPSATELLQHPFLTTPCIPMPRLADRQTESPIPNASPEALMSPLYPTYDTISASHHQYQVRDLNPNDKWHRRPPGDLHLEIVGPHADGVLIRLAYNGQEIKFPYTDSDSPSGIVQEMIKEGLVDEEDLQDVESAILGVLETWQRSSPKPFLLDRASETLFDVRGMERTDSVASDKPSLAASEKSNVEILDKISATKEKDLLEKIAEIKEKGLPDKIAEMQLNALNNLAKPQPAQPRVSLLDLQQAQLQKGSIL
jgi:serine/threonine protein kinase